MDDVFLVYHHETIADDKRNWVQSLARAGAANTLAVFDQKQRAVRGALDQRAITVKEAIFLPLQWLLVGSEH